MRINNLVVITQSKKKRLGLGHGSGRGKTAGRGTKGQKARHTIALHVDGADLVFLQRMPFMRGKGRNSSYRQKPVIVQVGQLALLPNNAIVDIKNLVAHKLIKEKDAAVYGVKILGDGDLAKPLTVKLPVSQAAREKIEKAGGTIETQ